LRIIAKKVLREFWEKHNDSEQALKTWFSEVKKSNWNYPKDIKILYPSASFIADNRIVFNIKGNNYRLIVKVNYDFKLVWIRFIGTHKDYDKINVKTI